MYRILAFLAITFCTCSLVAQTTITWKGGTPGRELAWNEPRNWDAQRVPDALDKVIIRLDNSGHSSQPVLDGTATVAWIELQSGGLLTITDQGVLTVDGRFTYSEGITTNGGTLVSDGMVVFVGLDDDESMETVSEPLVIGSMSNPDLYHNGSGVANYR